MGYYSDVRVSTTQEGFEFLKRCVTSDLFGGYGYVEVVNDEDGVVFGWNAVKWYSGFDAVAEFKNLLFVMNDKQIPYEYLEVGEDNATYSESSDYWGDIPDERLTHHIEACMTINVY